MKSINELLVVLVITLSVVVACAAGVEGEYNRSHVRMDIVEFMETVSISK